MRLRWRKLSPKITIRSSNIPIKLKYGNQEKKSFDQNRVFWQKDKHHELFYARISYCELMSLQV